MTLNDMIFPECILTNVRAETGEDVIRQLYEVLLREEKVRPSFYEAVLEREKSYPTGLKLDKWNVAIPHVVPEHVLNSALGIAVLDKPVIFRRMDDDAETVDVKVVFNIAYGKDVKQVELLRQLMKIVTDPGIIDKIVNAGSPETMATMLRKEIG